MAGKITIKALKSGRIERTKEEAIQADFLNKFFGDILGYDYNINR